MSLNRPTWTIGRKHPNIIVYILKHGVFSLYIDTVGSLEDTLGKIFKNRIRIQNACEGCTRKKEKKEGRERKKREGGRGREEQEEEGKEKEKKRKGEAGGRGDGREEKDASSSHLGFLSK